jgi:hypothetical protein
MRIVIGGDRFWSCRDLAADVLRRLVRRYGADIVVVHGGGNGVDQSFVLAAEDLGVKAEYSRVDFSRFNDRPFRHREMLKEGAGLCLIFSRAGLDERLKDLASQATEAGVPTYLIADVLGTPRRLKLGDGPL